MPDRLSVLPQYMLPKKAMTNFAGTVAGPRTRPAHDAADPLVRAPLRRRHERGGRARLSPATPPSTISSPARSSPAHGRWREAGLVCPVDGAISQFGDIHGDQILQAKGHRYRTVTLVGGDGALADEFAHGAFATLYLSPKDYHRVHMPCDGSAAPHDPRAGRAVLGQSGDGARRAGAVRPQRAGGVRVRHRARADGAGAGRRDHRRQHGHRLARRGQCAAPAAGCANGITTTVR